MAFGCCGARLTRGCVCCGAVLCWFAGAFEITSARGEAPRSQSTVSLPQSLAEMEATGIRMAFDVASVKPSASGGDAASRFALGAGDAFVPGDVFSAINQPLIAYLRFAFKLGQSDLSGLPSWIYDDRFDIEARSNVNATKDQMRLMMQSLLADRFKMRAHIEGQMRPVFELIRARRGRIGAQLRPHSSADACTLIGSGPSSIPCGRAGPVAASVAGHGRFAGRDVSVARLAVLFTSPFTGIDRPVLDRTDLAGTFDFDVEWALPPDSVPGPGTSVEVPEPTFLQALQEQLGLRLKSARGRVEVRVIDHIEPPTAN